MKKLILFFFILMTTQLFSQKILVQSLYFFDDNELKKIIKNNIDDINSLKKNIDKYFIQNGYIFTHVRNINLNPENNEIIINLEEGKIKKIEIFGNKKISDKVIKTYCNFKEGVIFNMKILRLQIKKLYTLKIYDSIKYETDESQKAILITVIEQKKKYFEINGNYTSQYGVMPYSGFINRNLFNKNIYMDINTEFGFWDKINFYNLNINFIYKKLYLNLGHRNGKTFINEDYYTSQEEKIDIGCNLYSSKYYNFYIFFPIEHYNFFNTKKFQDKTIINDWRYGIKGLFTYNNKRDVLNIRKENNLNLYYSSMLFDKKYNYTKLNIELKTYQHLFYGFGIIYKNNTGYIWGTTPFDKLIFIGGSHQRGYAEGKYITDLCCENSIEFENEILFNLLKIVLFADTSYFKNNNGHKLIISYGPGIILNISIFNIQVFYGSRIDNRFTAGNLHMNLYKMIY